MHTREALLPDAERIHDLISTYSTDGTLLPRTLAEICENVRDFIVLEEAGQVIGCGRELAGQPTGGPHDISLIHATQYPRLGDREGVRPSRCAGRDVCF